MKSIIVLLALGMSLEAIAAEEGTILASAHGPFEKFNHCLIEDGHTTIKISNGFGNNLTERSTVFHSTEGIKTLSTPALAGIGSRFFRWFPTQTEYKTRGDENTLIPYFKEGLENLHNDSEASDELRAQTDFFCNQLALDFRILGKFRVDLKIGDKVFADELFFKRTQNSFSNTKVEGTYSVPESFESKVKDLIYENGKFSFTIHVVEGEQEYDSLFEGTINNRNELKGKAFVLPDRSLLGEFTGAKL